MAIGGMGRRGDVRLEAVTATAPPGARELLAALGRGENGFGGTPVGEDPGQLEAWLDYCVHLATAIPLSDDFPAQASYWITDGDGLAVGLVRTYPRINAELRNRGGHLGYYVAPAHRGLGYGRAGLRLALAELRARGVGRALLTVEADNAASLSLVESQGGALEDERVDAATGHAYRRYWLETGVALP
jgi:predicted acetyltransferase